MMETTRTKTHTHTHTHTHTDIKPWFHAEIKLFYDGRPTGLKFFKIILF